MEKFLKGFCVFFISILFLGVVSGVFIFSSCLAIESSDNKIIILNFDDGPNLKALKDILLVLEKYQIKAHFFVMGAAVEQNKTLIREMHEKGFYFENHSWGHENFRKLYRNKGGVAIEKSLKRTEDVIKRITGRKPKYFRPPFWEIERPIENIVISNGYKVMKLGSPDVNTMDYEDVARHRDQTALIERVKKIVSSREKSGIYHHVLVFHELPLTAKALNVLIPYFLSRGYKFELLE